MKIIKKKKLNKKEKRKIEVQRKEKKLEKQIKRKEKRKNRDLKPVFGGVAVGIANIIPGVSGGTMLVIFNLFEKLMYSISDIFKRKTTTRKESFMFILKVLIGLAIGVILFAKILGFTLKHFEAETIFWFVGLILFSIPLIIKDEMKDEKFNIIFFALGFLIIGILQYFNMKNPSSFANDETSIFHLISLIFYGAIGGITMIFPGVSGSMVLLVLGKYEMIRGYIDSITKFDFKIYEYLAFFAVGAILGIILSAKLLSFLLKKYKGKTVSLILGFITASALILPLNLENKIEFDTKTVCAILGAFALGGIVNYYIYKFQEKKDI